VRVSFATQDERTVKHVLDALGTAPGYRLSPWLGHLMVAAFPPA
jgi:hypothetical protein